MSADLKYDLPESIFQTIFEKSPGSILVMADIHFFTILAVSDSYLKITSTTRDAVLGKGFFEVFPDDASHLADENAARNVFTRVIKNYEKIDVPTYRYDVYNEEIKAYEPRYWSCSNVPLTGADSKIAYILNTVADITGEVKAKEAALESANRLRLATEVTGLATWDLNLLNHNFLCSERTAEIFGQPPGTQITVKNLRTQITEDDMENIVINSFRKALISGEHAYEVKILWPDGSVHWIKTQGAIVFDKNKKPVRMLGTILDITESKRDEIRKNDFIAMASHELKTPLTSLKAYIQLLTKKIPQIGDPFIYNALIKANNQINKMSDLIYGFLDLSRLEAGKLQLKMQPFDINKLIVDIINEIMMITYNHNIIFNPDNVIMVDADRDKIGQVVNNFLSNAIKYSPKESPIFISSKIIDNNIQVAIADEGVGINAKDQEKLFQRFYRVENEKLKQIAGFGIGLYLASEIIMRHKGKTWVQSQEDKGSTFYFSLPLN
jgi:two-component system sensor histidine kinase VicK